MNAPFRKFYNMIVKTSQQWFEINGKNALGCSFKVECMNLSETNFSRTAESQRLYVFAKKMRFERPGFTVTRGCFI